MVVPVYTTNRVPLLYVQQKKAFIRFKKKKIFFANLYVCDIVSHSGFDLHFLDS